MRERESEREVVGLFGLPPVIEREGMRKERDIRVK